MLVARRVRKFGPQVMSGIDPSSATSMPSLCAASFFSVTEEVTALAVYGSLIPGEKDHWVVRGIQGEWQPGTVRGFAFEITWGPAEGYDGFLPDENGNHVPVMVLTSDQLDKHWRSVDDFLGDGFARQIVPVALSVGSVINAWIYAALTNS